ncbi:MAG: GTP cyclohydrolase II [Armatimonadetes bacterium]|nr:GTP cyclohydrolase II [Armatimonadota bacterium]MBX3109392.1 GTP cyclohydrolase II [Fimbriimonadaceae bacterium]
MIATIQEALQDLKNGKMVIVVDDPGRENEGDLIMLGEHTTAEDMNFMIKEGRGVPFISTTPERLDQLGIPMMTKANTARLGTAMAETVDAIEGTTTGVSAGDRAKTVAVLCDEKALPGDLMRPGHMLVLRAEPGGVLRRAGHTEASVDLARLCGSVPVGVGVEIIGDDGEMLRLGGGLEDYALKHGLKIITIEDLIAYRRRTETLIERKAGPIEFPTKYGTFTIYAYETEVEPEPFIAIVKGEITPEPVLVRVHSSCLTGDILGSLRCDCGDQLAAALQMIESAGSGVVLYIAQEGRGIGIVNKLRAYELQDGGLDTVEANEALGFKPDQRDYGLGSQVLYDLGVRKMRLMSNNPAKRAGLQGFGLEIVETVPLITPPTEHSEKYIETKRDKMGHLIP